MTRWTQKYMAWIKRLRFEQFGLMATLALQALRGVAKLTAATVLTELGQLSRFESPNQLMACCGLVPSEHSSGSKIRKGAITKTGNVHVRRVIVESSWC